MVSTESGMKIFTLEANIGAGKTTLLNALQEAEKGDPCICGPTLLEPVQQWMAPNPALPMNRSILQAFYEDPIAVGASFQSLVVQTRLTQLLDNMQHRQVVTERSIWSSRAVFGDMVVSKQGPQWIAYDAWAAHAEWAVTHVAHASMAGIIYLRTSAEVCAARIASRRRLEESELSLEYLQHLHERHERWVHSYAGVPVMILDGDRSIDDSLQEHVAAIRAFISDAE